MIADGNQSILFTTDGIALGSSNCVGILFDYYSNFLFRSSTFADGTNASALNIK